MTEDPARLCSLCGRLSIETYFCSMFPHMVQVYDSQLHPQSAYYYKYCLHFRSMPASLQAHDKVVDGVPSTATEGSHQTSPSSPVKVVEDFMNNARRLSSQDSFVAVVQMFDNVAKLQSRADEQDKTAERFAQQMDDVKAKYEAKLQDTRTRHEEVYHKLLEMHRGSFAKVESEKQALQKSVSDLGKELENERGEANKLKKQIRAMETSVQSKVDQVNAGEARIGQLQSDKERVNQELTARKGEIGKLKNALKTEQQRTSGLGQSMNTLQQDKKSVTEQLRAAKKELDKVKDFAKEIHQESPDTL